MICNFFSLLAVMFVTVDSGIAQEPKPPLFQLHSSDGAAHIGPLAQLSEDWSVTLDGHEKRPGSEVVALRRSKAVLPAFPREGQVMLANGDRIPGTVLQIAGERLRLQAEIGKGQELSLPLTALAVVWFAAPDNVDSAPALIRRLATERRRRDVLLLRNGDTIEGVLADLNEKQARLEGVQGKETRVDRDKVAAIALNTALARLPRPRGPFGHLVLTNGCRLSLVSAHSKNQVLAGKTAFNAAVQVPFEQIATLQLRQGAADYLSDLKPRAYEHTPFLGVRWPYVPDGSVTGGDLRLADSTYDKGLGLHSESQLTYDLGAGYRWFEAVVGLDDQTGRQGDVVVEVRVDGKPQKLGAAQELTGQDPPLSIRIPVSGARDLSLIVKFGRGGDVQDHVDWVDARLIR
jgi:hypothetical protein